jgi:hypothetical protein
MKFYLMIHDTLHGFYKKNDFLQIIKKSILIMRKLIYIYINPFI